MTHYSTSPFNKNLCICLTFAAYVLPLKAHADIYISEQDADEIRITNTPQLGSDYTRLSETLTIKTPLLAKNNNTKNLPYHNAVILAAAETSIEPALIHAVIAVESQHNSRAVSSKGAFGLMQLMPATAKRFNVKNKNDPQQNILAGARYLRELEILYQGNINLMLAAYNAGPAAVEKYHRQIPPYLETQLYVPKVLKLYQRYSI